MAGLVHAPAFNLYLVSISGEEGTAFVPVGPSAVSGMTPGKPIELEEALATLAEHARKVEAEFGEAIRDRRVVD